LLAESKQCEEVISREPAQQAQNGGWHFFRDACGAHDEHTGQDANGHGERLDEIDLPRQGRQTCRLRQTQHDVQLRRKQQKRRGVLESRDDRRRNVLEQGAKLEQPEQRLEPAGQQYQEKGERE
jgi:hypothetical protein